MTIDFRHIRLRDFRREDLPDYIRWMTEETGWHDWDAPWDAEEDFRRFDAGAFCAKKLDELERCRDESTLHWSFELDTDAGFHIGWVNSYLNDTAYRLRPTSQGGCLHTLGIDICEPAFRHKGYGAQALAALIQYHLSQGITDLYTETWIGNGPMLSLAEKLGFEKCHVEHAFRTVDGRAYDGVTFRLCREKFKRFLRSQEAGLKPAPQTNGEET